MFTVARLNVEAGATIGGALSGLRTLTRAVGAFGGFLGGIAQTALGVLGGQALFAGLSAGFQSTIGSAIGLNATLENNAVAFTTLLGNSQAAQTFLAELRKFAAETPFEFVGLAETSKIMLGMGFTAKQIIPLLTDIGNVAAGLSLGGAGAQHLGIVLGQMHTSGRVLGQDLLQLQQMGINTSEVFGIMATQTGKSVEELKRMQQAGKLPSDWFITAFQTFAKLKFPNMLQAQAHTFTGIWENVKENLHNAFGDMFAPLFQMLKRVGQAILDFEATATFARWVAQAQGWIGTITTVLGAFASTWQGINATTNLGVLQSGLVALELTIRSTFGPEAAGWFHNALTFFQTDLPAAWATLQGAWNTLKPTLDALAAWFVNNAAPVAAFTVTFALFGVVVGTVTAILATLLSPMFLLSVAVALLAAAWVGNWGNIQGIVLGFWAAAEPILLAVWTWLSVNIPAALTIAAGFWTSTLLPPLEAIGTFLSTVLFPYFAALGGFLAAIFLVALVPIGQALGLLRDFGAILIGTILPPLQALWAWLSQRILPILQAVGGGLASINQQAPDWLQQLTASLNTSGGVLTAQAVASGGLPGPIAAAVGGGGSVDNSRTVTINNPVVRTDADLAALTAQAVAAQAATGQASAAGAAPNTLVGAA